MSATIPQAETPAIAVVPTVQPEGVTPPVDPNTPASPQAASETEATTDSNAGFDDQPRDDKGRFTKASERIQRQIGELTAQKHQARRELEALQRQVSTIQRQYAAASKVDPNDYDAVQGANAAKAALSVQHTLAQTSIEDASQRLALARGEAFFAKVEAVRERIPDIDQALQSFARVPLSDPACDVIAESDKAAELANYLGRNPAEAARIVRLAPQQQAIEIVRLENRITAQPVKRISQAPAPVQTLSGGPSSPGVDLSSLSMADYMKARMEGAGR